MHSHTWFSSSFHPFLHTNLYFSTYTLQFHLLPHSGQVSLSYILWLEHFIFTFLHSFFLYTCSPDSQHHFPTSRKTKSYFPSNFYILTTWPYPDPTPLSHLCIHFSVLHFQIIHPHSLIQLHSSLSHFWHHQHKFPTHTFHFHSLTHSTTTPLSHLYIHLSVIHF